jgi:regulatory protein
VPKPIPPEKAASDEAAKEAALRMLARGPRTEHEVVDRLIERGYVPDAVERAVERLRRVSLLDDRAYLAWFVRHEVLRKPQGKRLLSMKLKRRGVAPALLAEMEALLGSDRDLIERSLASEEGRAQAAAAQIRKRLGGRAPEKRAGLLQAALLRRGFTWDTIRDLNPGDPSEENRASDDTVE